MLPCICFPGALLLFFLLFFPLPSPPPRQTMTARRAVGPPARSAEPLPGPPAPLRPRGPVPLGGEHPGGPSRVGPAPLRAGGRRRARGGATAPASPGIRRSCSPGPAGGAGSSGGAVGAVGACGRRSGPRGAASPALGAHRGPGEPRAARTNPKRLCKTADQSAPPSHEYS